MSVFELVARAVGLQRVAEVKATREVDTPYTWPMWRENADIDWTPSTLAGFGEAGYQGNALVYACISRRAESAAFAPLVGYTGDRTKPERLPDTAPLAMLLQKPNAYQSWYEFMELLITYLDLDGNAFVVKEMARPGAPISGLWPLRSDRARPVPKDGRLLGYVYDDEAGGRTPYLTDEIIHVKYPNPVDPFEGLGRGSSPLGAAAKPTDVDNSATSFLKNFFDQAVVPFGLLKSKQRMLDTEVVRVRERLKAQYGGAQNWGEVMILDADAEYQRLGLSMQEMTFGDLDARNEARICMVLKVPPIIAGAKIGLDRSTFANYGEARSSFWEDSLIPGIYRRFEDAFDGGLAPHFPGQWVAYDFSQVPALREDMSGKWEIAVRAFLGGVARRNEARALIDLPPVPPEEDGFRAAEQQQIGAPAITQKPVTVGSAAEDEVDNPSDDEGDGKSADPFGRVGIREKARRDDGALALRLGIERRWAPKLTRALRAQLRAALPTGTTGDTVWQAESRMEQGSAAIRDVLYQMMREAALAGLADGQADVDAAMGTAKELAVPPMGEIGIEVDWELINAQVLEWLNSYSFELVRQLTEHNREVMRAAIQRWVQNGLPLSDLINELASIFGEKRAAVIAATEVTRAFAEANLAAWLASGVVSEVVWRTVNDERVCPICAPLGGVTWSDDGEAVPTSILVQREHGQATPLGQPFVHPGGAGVLERYAGREYKAPPAHPRCRCFLHPVVSRR
jgi:HK97 family phage portal protein